MTTAAALTIPFARPWITEEERQAVTEVLASPILTHGPQGKAFEAEFGAFLGEGAHCVSVSSCMAALHLAYLHFGIGPGDEVIVPAQTHAATAHAVEWVGARPVFVDCDPKTGNLTARDIEAAVTPRTRALSVVHFVGIPCDMPTIVEIAERYSLIVIEDCAVALGARVDGRHVGLFGDAGGFSFYPAKHITTGEGGMFVTRHPMVAAAVGKLRAFGVDRASNERGVPGLYDVPILGLNYRMSELQAALGRVQLRRIEENLRRRRANFTELQRALQGVPDVRVLDAEDVPPMRSSHYCLVLVLEGRLRGRRGELIARLNAAGVGTSIYYPHPVPRLSYYRHKYGYDAARVPAAAAISDESLALPVGPHVSDDLGCLVEQVVKVLDEVRG